MKIAHLTSVHPRYDTRIFRKECRSLAEAGHEVCLVVADGKGDENRDGVRIFDVGASKNRLDRMFRITFRVLRKARTLDADLYQVHDVELLPMALLLHAAGRTVVYDAHEDVPGDLLSRSYLPKAVLRLLSRIVGPIELFIARRLAAVVAATPAIAGRFHAVNPRTVAIQNFPLTAELASPSAIPWADRDMSVAYVGGLDLPRGAREMVSAMGMLPGGEKITLKLAGTFTPSHHRDVVAALPGWSRVEELGQLDRPGVAALLGRVRAGLVLFLPYLNHVNAQPNKMFEYMSAGIPVIASDFPLWRQLVEKHGCGLLVDPRNPAAIADAIVRMVKNPDEAEAMGRRGREAVEQGLNWEHEAGKLIKLCGDLTG